MSESEFKTLVFGDKVYDINGLMGLVLSTDDDHEIIVYWEDCTETQLHPCDAPNVFLTKEA